MEWPTTTNTKSNK